MSADLDAIMRVMEAAFDPAFGEAWTRRQVADALALPHTHYLLAGPDGQLPEHPRDACGFTMSRRVLDEEELLLIAVAPEARGQGVGEALIARFIAVSESAGVTRQFLEMRDGNPAHALYRRLGFEPVGRRRGYYNSGREGPFDAITYARDRS